MCVPWTHGECVREREREGKRERGKERELPGQLGFVCVILTTGVGWHPDVRVCVCLEHMRGVGLCVCAHVHMSWTAQERVCAPCSHIIPPWVGQGGALTLPTPPPLTSPPCTGLQREDRVLGGSECQEGAHPWLVLLYYFDKHYCSGALLNQNWVLTAAHCSMR